MSSNKYLPGPESYREFRETGPWSGRGRGKGRGGGGEAVVCQYVLNKLPIIPQYFSQMDKNIVYFIPETTDIPNWYTKYPYFRVKTLYTQLWKILYAVYPKPLVDPKQPGKRAC